MHLLDYFYEQNFSKIKLNSRKVVIDDSDTFLYGVVGCGKTHIIYDFLLSKQREKYLYLDFSNEKFEDIDAWKIELFIKNNNIELLVLDGYDFRYLKLPEVKQTVILSNRLQTHKSMKNFKKQEIFPLDFEEFIAYSKKSSQAEQLFDRFMTNGNLPEFCNTEYNIDKKKQKFIKSCFSNHMKYLLFVETIKYQSSKVSKLKIFNDLKSKVKVSKDFVYETLEEFESSLMLRKLPSLEKKNIFKYFLFDFSLKSNFFLQKGFNHHFENMVFLKLYREYGDVYFTSLFDFIVPKEKCAFLVISFSAISVIKRRIKNIVKKTSCTEVENIKIITINTSAIFMDSKIRVEVIPFYVWAVS